MMDKLHSPDKMTGTETAYFAAGCFWGVESAFMAQHGVEATAVGYMGGRTDTPTYQDVCSGSTGHAEAVEVAFNPQQVSYEDLCRLFFQIHDPTTLNRQGPDIGTQYRSAVFVTSLAQKETFLAVKAELECGNKFDMPIVTEIQGESTFWRAEDYHQQYFKKRGMEATCHLPVR